MSPSYQRQIMDFCRGKDVRAMHEVLRNFKRGRAYCLADITVGQFKEIMRKLHEAHERSRKV